MCLHSYLDVKVKILFYFFRNSEKPWIIFLILIFFRLEARRNLISKCINLISQRDTSFVLEIYSHIFSVFTRDLIFFTYVRALFITFSSVWKTVNNVFRDQILQLSLYFHIIFLLKISNKIFKNCCLWNLQWRKSNLFLSQKKMFFWKFEYSFLQFLRQKML